MSPAPDPAPLKVQMNSDGVAVVLPDDPDFQWTVRLGIFDGQAALTYVSCRTAPGTPSQPIGHKAIPHRSLVNIAARFLGLTTKGKAANLPRIKQMLKDGTFDNWDDQLWSVLLDHVEVIDLPRAPDKRNYKLREMDPAYITAMKAWSKPIADEVWDAALRRGSWQDAVAARFGKEIERARQLISDARRFHELPSRPDKDDQ